MGRQTTRRPDFKSGGVIMRFMEFENGQEAGRQAVEDNVEFDWKLSDYKNYLKDLLHDPSYETATASEKKEYSAGFMDGVENALDDLAYQGIPEPADDGEVKE
jgi:hypothetical protein